MGDWSRFVRTMAALVRRIPVRFLVLTLIGIPVLLSGLTTGCGKAITDEKKLDFIREKLTGMKSYQAVVNYHSGNSSGVYTMRQFYREPASYRTEILSPEEIKGLTTVFDGMNSVTWHPGVSLNLSFKSTMEGTDNKLFLSAFTQNIQDSESTPMKIETWKDGKKYGTMELTGTENTRYFTGVKLWVDLETQKPCRLEIRHAGQENSLWLEYMEFQYNPQLEDKVFELQ